MTSPAIIRPAQPVKLYRYPLFGHSHRVELFLSLLDLPVESIDVDLAAGAQKAPAYLEMNPFSQGGGPTASMRLTVGGHGQWGWGKSARPATWRKHA